MIITANNHWLIKTINYEKENYCRKLEDEQKL
jgi:hypothetical protein